MQAPSHGGQTCCGCPQGPKPSNCQSQTIFKRRRCSLSGPNPSRQAKTGAPRHPPLVWWLPGTSEGNASPLPWGSDLLWVPTRAQAIKLPKPNHFQTALLQLERAQPQPAGQNWSPTPHEGLYSGQAATSISLLSGEPITCCQLTVRPGKDPMGSLGGPAPLHTPPGPSETQE